MLWSSVVAASLFVAMSSAADPLGPGAGPWSVELPSDQATRDRLEQGKQWLYSNARTRNCYVVVKDGAIIYEAGNPDSAHTAYSMTKTLGALLMGSGVQNHNVDIDASTTKYGVPSPVRYDVTTRQIMSQTVAGKWAGEKWEYDTVGSNWLKALPTILSNAVKQDLGRERSPSEIFDEELRAPLGLSPKFSWSPSPNSDWAAGSSGSCRDWARIGQLMLNKGKWAGRSKPIVPESYVNDMITPQRFNSTTYSNTCYGLMTWLNTRPNSKYPGDCYLAMDVKVTADRYMPEQLNDYFILGGFAGQNVVVIPEDRMVIASLGFTIPDLQGLTKNAQKMVEAAWCQGLGKC